MADDLDAFFEEVTAAEEEAKNEVGTDDDKEKVGIKEEEKKKKKKKEFGFGNGDGDGDGDGDNGDVTTSRDDGMPPPPPTKKTKSFVSAATTSTPAPAAAAAKPSIVVAAKPAISASLALAPSVGGSGSGSGSGNGVGGSGLVTTISPMAPAVSSKPGQPPPPPPPPPLPPGPIPSRIFPGVSAPPTMIGPSSMPLPTIGPTIGAVPGSSINAPPLPPGLPPSHLVAANDVATATANQKHHQQQQQRLHKRAAAGKTWVDPTLSEFPNNDFRLFVGNLAKDIRDDQLADAFRSRYPSYVTCRIARNKDDGKSRGYGFVSLMDPKDCARALREMDQTWLGSRPIKVRRSEWKDRDLKEVRKKQRHDKRKNKRHLY